MLKNAKIIFLITGIAFLAAFFLGFLNIHFAVINQKLSKDIEELDDQKANLQNQYLSEVSMPELNNKAEAMQMKHLATTEYYKISASKEKDKIQTAKKEKKILIISGY